MGGCEECCDRDDKNRTSTKRKSKRYQFNFRNQILLLATGAISLVAALAWNDAAQKSFREFIPQNIFALYLYAIIITILSVILIYIITIFLS